jgi:hypothetical protein
MKPTKYINNQQQQQYNNTGSIYTHATNTHTCCTYTSTNVGKYGSRIFVVLVILGFPHGKPTLKYVLGHDVYKQLPDGRREVARPAKTVLFQEANQLIMQTMVCVHPLMG